MSGHMHYPVGVTYKKQFSYSGRNGMVLTFTLNMEDKEELESFLDMIKKGAQDVEKGLADLDDGKMLVKKPRKKRGA